MSEPLHIVDGGGFVYRAYHATAGRGPTAALQTFAGMLDRLERDHRPRRAVLAMDSRGRTWRHELYTEYKAGRPPAPPDLIAQLPRFGPLAAAQGWPVVATPGLEADDLVAAGVVRARAADVPVVIHAADKDLLQLVGPGVRMVDAVRGVEWDAQLVEARIGVPPARVADYLALLGDAGDNVPGLAGVGEKTAVELVRRFANLEELIAANPKVRGKYPVGDVAGAELLRLSHRLVVLRGDVELGRELAELVIGRRNTATIRELTAPPRPPEQLELGARAAAPPGRSLPVSDRPPGAKPPWSHEPGGQPVWSRPGLAHLEAEYSERAALLEYDGGLVRAEAEYRAYNATAAAVAE